MFAFRKIQTIKRIRSPRYRKVLGIAFIFLFSTAIAQEQKQINFKDPSLYGGKSSVGFALLGASIAGGYGRIFVANRTLIETGIAFRPIIIGDRSSGISWRYNILMVGGLTQYFSKGLDYTNSKIRSDGIFVKAGYATGYFNETMMAFGWSRERFHLRSYSNSLTTELGFGFTWLVNRKGTSGEYGIIGEEYSPILYLKFQWNNYLGNKKH